MTGKSTNVVDQEIKVLPTLMLAIKWMVERVAQASFMSNE